MSTWPLRRIVAPRAFAVSRTISARSSGASGRALPLRSWNSRECGVRTAFLPTRHFGSAATALIASAARTMGSGMLRTTSRIASRVPEASPSPGPIATASTRGVSSMICRRSSRNRRCPTRGCTMNVGEYDATTVAADAGVAMWTRSMPIPREPNPTSAKAPFGPDPQEGIDEKIRLGDGLFAPVQAREDLHVPQSLEVRLGLLRVELVRGAGEQGGHARLLRQMAGGDEAVSTVVPRSAQDQDALPRRAEFRPSHLSD